MARHFRVALNAFLTLVAWAVPIVAGGFLTAQYVATANDGEGAVLVRADPAGLAGLTALLIVHVLGWAGVAWLGRRRQLPSGTDIRYLDGVARIASEELRGESGKGGAVWREPRGRTDLVTRLVGGSVGMGRWTLREGRVVRM